MTFYGVERVDVMYARQYRSDLLQENAHFQMLALLQHMESTRGSNKRQTNNGNSR